MRLWEYDEFGEPWLENGAPLVIVNRKPHKKGKKKMARRRRRVTRRRVHARGRKHTVRRRRRTRRNPWTMPGAVAAMNPRRRRRGRKHASRRRRRSSGRRNPALFGFSLPPLQSVLYAGVGFVGVPMAEGFLTRFLPISLTGSTIGKYATRIGALLGLTYLAKLVIGSNESKMVAIGGGAYILTSAVTEFAPGLIPSTTLGSYARPTLGSYAGSTSNTFNQLGRLGAPNFGAQNTVASAPFGGARIVSQRFRRFQ